jgi:hypothetical protein
MTDSDSIDDLVPTDQWPTCKGVGEVDKFLPSGLTTHPGSGLGDARKRTCPACDGSGTIGGR